MGKATGSLVTAALILRRLGFSAQETGRLVALRRRYEHAVHREAPPVPARWRFVRWLIEQGRLSDAPATPITEPHAKDEQDAGRD